jgi:hypothetical protein
MKVMSILTAVSFVSEMVLHVDKIKP